MITTFTDRLNAVAYPLVCQALADERAEVLDWRYQPVGGGLAQSLGSSYGLFAFLFDWLQQPPPSLPHHNVQLGNLFFAPPVSCAQPAFIDRARSLGCGEFALSRHDN